VPEKIATVWVADDRILPLLDGLDEVAAEHRLACLTAINAFRKERAKSLLGLVVTSRVTEYEALAAQLRLRGAVLLQPLLPEQIEAYLDSAGSQLAGVRLALQADPILRELAKSPLLLSTMSLAYQGASAELLPTTGSLDERRAHIFAPMSSRCSNGGARLPATRDSKRSTAWGGWRLS
jgi:hypothetical protein